MKKRGILSAVIVALLVFQTMIAYADAGGLGNFRRELKYSEDQFTDVSGDAWYRENVKTVYELGLMKGNSNTSFNPQGNVTVAETIVMAARLHSIYHKGSADFEQSAVWYEPYVDYAIENRLINGVTKVDYNESATRATFAMALNAALPKEVFSAINNVEAIPDVPADVVFGEAVYMLYNAGVLSGNDKYGTFEPESSIQRCAVAAMLSRVIDKDLRLRVSLEKKPFTPVPISELSNLKGLKKKLTDQQFRQAYDEAVKIVTPFAGYSREEQIVEISRALRVRFDEGMEYSMDSPNYNNPYGYLIEKSASCAGCTRATGLCLNILGIPYEHVNENQYSHQWCRVNTGGEYWICDAYGLYAGPEPAPYQHPYF